MHDAHSSMNSPTAQTYNTTAGTTLIQIINQSGGHAPLRTNVHTINSTTLCVMQWMQLFLACNEMPASGPHPLHCSELAYRSCL